MSPSSGEAGADCRLVWTRQHRQILPILREQGRYIVQQCYIEQENEDTARFFLEVYSWYAQRAAQLIPKPADVRFPIWISLSEQSRLLPRADTVCLELLLPTRLVLPVDMTKWSSILNYDYLPADSADARRHRELLLEYNCPGDAQAYLSQFFPQIKREIRDSWERLFQPTEAPTTATIWEVRQEWLQRVLP